MQVLKKNLIKTCSGLEVVTGWLSWKGLVAGWLSWEAGLLSLVGLVALVPELLSLALVPELLSLALVPELLSLEVLVALGPVGLVVVLKTLAVWARCKHFVKNLIFFITCVGVGLL